MSKLTQDQKNERRAKRIEKKEQLDYPLRTREFQQEKEMRAIAKIQT